MTSATGTKGTGAAATATADDPFEGRGPRAGGTRPDDPEEHGGPGPRTAARLAALDARIAATQRSRATGAALTTLIGVAAAYLMLTWDTRGSIGDALAYPGHLDVDFAVAVLAFFMMHAVNQWRADGRELARLRHERADLP